MRIKRGVRLLCLGAAVSLLWSNSIFAIEMVPPNPLSSGVYTESAAAEASSYAADVQPGGTGITEAPAAGAGLGNVTLPGGSPSAQDGGVSQNAAGESITGNTAGNVTGETVSGNGVTGQTAPGNEATGQTAAGNGIIGETTGGNTDNTQADTAQTTPLPSALEGTVFAGSAKVAAPAVAAEGAVLLNANTGQILFDKNARTPFYPASITKIMTALLTVENCNLTDVVTFSKTATTNLESGAVTISLTEGDQLTVKDSLYALLLKSANEVANGLAEHMGGSIDNFANMMNLRAAQLGCTGTHFANPNGLNNATHLTTPYDMALIARAAYANPVISQISTTTAYQMPATKLGAAKTITMGHKMLYPTDSRYYPGMVGGKTGYTSKAGNTLVTCVEQNGVRLVVVVMKASGTHYTDTKALLDYGFALAANGEI